MYKLFVFACALLPSIKGSEISDKAAEFAQSLCVGVTNLTKVDPTYGDLINVYIGPENYIEKILYDTTCGDLMACVQQYQPQLIQAGLRIGIGILFAIVTILLYLLMAPCACCRCCRQCRIWCCFSERFNAINMSTRKRAVLLSFLVLFIGVLIADFVYASRFRTDIGAGAQSAVCETFRLTDNALNGFEETTTNADGSVTVHNFLGAENVASAVQDIVDIVQDNSPTITAIIGVVNTTKDIQFAVSNFLVNLNNMNSILGDPTNLQVGQFECVFCQTCCSGGNSSQVGLALTSIQSSVASALVAVRQNVADTLTGSGLSGIRTSLQASADMVDGFKSQFEDALGQQLIDNEPLFEQAISYLNMATLIAMCLVILPAVLLFLVFGIGVGRSNRKTYTSLNLEPQNPCHASCAWCLTFVFALVLFVLAGIFGIAAYLEASTCEIVSDMDTLITAGGSRLGIAPGSQLETILQTCLTPEGSGDILGAVDVGNGQTARQMLDIGDLINSQFDLITAGLGNGTNVPSFSTNADIVALLDAVRDFGSLYVIPGPTVASLLADPAYSPSASLLTSQSATTLGDLLTIALSGVPDCADRAAVPLTGPAGTALRAALVAAGFTLSDSATSVDLPGIATYFAALQNANIDIGETGSVCPDNFENLNLVANSPFGSFMKFRIDVLLHEYRCDTITVSEDTATGDAVVVVNPATCTWSQWVSYVNNFHADLLALAQTVDTVQLAVLNGIQVDLRAIVQQDVLPLIARLTNGLDCKFLQVRWTGMYESLCWRETPGLVGSVICWLIFGWLCILAIILEFVIWRHLKDNRSIWADQYDNGDDKQGKDTGSTMNSKEGTMIQISPDGHVMVMQQH